MRTEKDRSRLGWVGSWLFARGESFSGTLGLSLVALLVLLVGAGGAWTLLTRRDALIDAEQRSLSASARVLVFSAAQTLETGDITRVRALLNEAAVEHGLREVTLTVPGVGVVAREPVGKVDVDELPSVWAGGEPTAATSRREGGEVRATVSAEVPSRGSVEIELVKHAPSQLWGDARVHMGLGIIAASGMLCAGVLYRFARSRTRGLGAIQESLRHASLFAKGEAPVGSLRVSDTLGEEARAWNHLLEERENLRSRRALEDAASRLHDVGGSGDDYAAAFDALWLGLIVLDQEGKARTVNGAAAVLLKHQRAEMLSREASAIVRDEGVARAVRGIVSGETRQRAMVEAQIEDAQSGDRTILRFTIRPMRREDSSSAMIVIEDVTQQRVADDSRNMFVAQATHELRTPLTNIRLYLEQLVEEGESDPRVKARCLNVINQEVRRLDRTVTDMLSVTEIESGTFRLQRDDVRLDALFVELEEDFAALAKDKEIELRFDLPPKWPVMGGDRDKVAMALHNLVGNALKYTPAGGHVSVRVSTDEHALRVDVQDNGFGIPEEEQQVIFEKFYRGKDKRVVSIGGSGIGLALARQVVRLHGGDITVQSELDKGSTFTLTLPLATPQAQRMAA